MSAVYERPGVRFEYPENWMLDEEDGADGERSVSVYSPEGAFWTIALHPPFTASESLLDAALSAMQEEYPELDTEQVDEQIGQFPAIGYDMNFYCLDLTSTAKVRCVSTPDTTYLIFYQAEDRELARIERVFHAMTFSLLSS